MNSNLENAKAQMRKGVLELCILSIIAESESYPSGILKKLKASNLIVVEGTLYPLITRLKDAGMLEYRWEESKEGPPRKYYQLTESGRTALIDMHTAWKELVNSVEKITNPSSFIDSDTNDTFFVQTEEIINQNEII